MQCIHILFLVGDWGLGRKPPAGRTVWIGSTWAYCLEMQCIDVLFFVGDWGLGRKPLAGRTVCIGSTWMYCMHEQYMGTVCVLALLHSLHRDAWFAGWGSFIPRTGGSSFPLISRASRFRRSAGCCLCGFAAVVPASGFYTTGWGSDQDALTYSESLRRP